MAVKGEQRQYTVATRMKSCQIMIERSGRASGGIAYAAREFSNRSVATCRNAAALQAKCGMRDYDQLDFQIWTPPLSTVPL